MYFDFEDRRPDIDPIGRAISWREGTLLSVIVHLMGVVLILLLPELPVGAPARRVVDQAELQRREREARRFVFVQPRVDLEAQKPPPRADDSDKHRLARAIERALKPTNPLPFARGNSPERAEADRAPGARGRESATEAAKRTGDSSGSNEADRLTRPDAPARVPSVEARAGAPDGTGGRAGGGPSSALGEALRNLQRYVQPNSFDNPGGGVGALGPSIQFDTKGVEFGPWIRRFVAQIKRNWFIPYAAMAMKGHVVTTFYVHKDGTISELSVPGPCAVDAFNHAAFNALTSSNPTQPLPAEYPADRAFFTVTFFYNETPPVP